MVYFSRLSKINVTKRYFVLICLGLSLCLIPLFIFKGDYLNLNGFYYRVYWLIFVYILGILIFFINFRSYFLNFSGALRKV